VSGASDKNALLSLLTERRTQYLEAAKGQKNAQKNKEYRLIAAQFSRVLKGVKDGQDIDLSKMPGPPPGYKSSYNVDTAKFTSPPTAQPTKPVAAAPQGQSSEPDEPDAPPDPDIPTPKTTMDALEQRVAKYKEGLKTAQEKGESSRIRRMGRIIKQYESAIKNTRAGKACDYDDLPAPPGYPPIPTPKPQRQMAAVPLPTQSLPVKAMTQQTAAAAKPSISQQQVAFIERRMTELKRAAKMEQGKGNRDGALEYLRKVKGLETMLQAAQSGLPVNLEQVPPSPFAELDKTMPSSEVMSHLRPAEEKDAATFELIIKQLEKQIEICEKNTDTYKKMGSSASAIEYENMSQNVQRELLALKGIQVGGYGPPKFSLETRTLTIIHSNTHLSGAVCEVEVAKAINLTCPPKYEEKDLDVYVEVEFPYPVESTPKKSTDTVHKSCSPEFLEKSLQFEIDRKHHRSMARAFKRTPLKCTVWQQRSLRKDIYMGMEYSDGLGKLPY
jgi:coiled-coil and C2 domain-containing protein 1